MLGATILKFPKKKRSTLMGDGLYVLYFTSELFVYVDENN